MTDDAKTLYRLLMAYKTKGIKQASLDVEWAMSVLEQWPKENKKIEIKSNNEVDGGLFGDFD